jgi:putative SOS response-associated peptidase YedK
MTLPSRAPYGPVITLGRYSAGGWDAEPFAMAGIYARGENETHPMTFAILTTQANDLTRPVHDRMPVC